MSTPTIGRTAAARRSPWRYDPRVIGGALIGSLTALAWLAIWAWDSGPWSEYLSHDQVLAGGGTPAPAGVGLFVVGWVLMSAAMMLPSVHKLVLTFLGVIRARPDRGRLQAALLAGYLTVWTAVGVLALAADWVVHRGVEAGGLASQHEWAISAGVLALAGAYQLSPLKNRCLDECRSPLTFVLGHWRGGNPVGDAFRLGVAHGKFCVGCCAALMGVLFALGMGSLGWMFLAAAAMTVEKIVSWGRLLTAPIGLALLAAAAAMTLLEIV